MSRILRTAVTAIAVLLSLAAMGSYVAASGGGEFYLDDISVKSGRLFEVTLCAENIEDIAAFVVRISYAPGNMEYRETASYRKGSSFYVNSDKQGELTAVYLMKDGLDCADKTATLTFKFKSLKASESTVSLRVYDAIDKSGVELTDYTTSSTTVTVSSSGRASLKSGSKTVYSKYEGKDNVAGTDPGTDTTLDEAVSLVTVKGRDHNTELVVSICIFAALILVIAVVCAYELGKRRSLKPSERLPLEYNRRKRKGKEEEI